MEELPRLPLQCDNILQSVEDHIHNIDAVLTALGIDQAQNVFILYRLCRVARAPDTSRKIRYVP